MEYHADRFKDFSLLVRDQKERIVAVLPANRNGDTLYSHQGLTYGGILLSRKLKLAPVLQIFRELLIYLEKRHITTLQIKQSPSFYHAQPSDEMEYLLHVCEASCNTIDASAVIQYGGELPIQPNRIEGVRKAKNRDLRVVEEADFKTFWNTILIPNLEIKHKAKPTHALKEIIQLQQNFPNCIRHFNVYKDKKVVGGATIFETTTVAHVQYISASEEKQQYGTLDFLFTYLIQDIFKHKQYFDFGTSSEGTAKINNGLTYWKESFGARTITHRQYAVACGNHTLLENVFV